MASIHLAHALPAHAHELAARGRAWRGVSHDPRPAAESAGAAGPSTVWWWYATLCALYGIHLAVLFYVTMVLREFVSLDVFSPGWVSVRLLAWLSAVTAAVAALLMWLNLRGLPAVFDEAASHRFDVRRGRDDGVSGRAARHRGRALLVRAPRQPGRRHAARDCVDGLARAADCRPRARRRAAPGRASRDDLRRHRPTRRCRMCVVLLLDGASLEFVWPRAAEGRLPNFGRLLDGGASLDLATIRPTQPDPVWAAVATGMYPAKNGVRSATSYFAARRRSRDRSAPGSLFLAGARPARHGPRRAQIVGGMAGAADLVGARTTTASARGRPLAADLSRRARFAGFW